MKAGRSDHTMPPLDALPGVSTILVFACNLLGDSICRLPAIRATSGAYPEGRVCVVCDSRYADVFAGHRFIERLQALDRRGGPLSQARAWASLTAWARRQRPDLVLDLYGSKRTALVAWLSGARWRLGLYRQGTSHWYNVREPADRPVPQEGHLIERMNRLSSLAGISAPFAYCPLPVDEETRAAANATLDDAGLGEGERLVLLNPAARVPAKRWPAERFAALARRLHEEDQANCAVVTSPDSPELTEAITRASQGTAVPLPALSLKELAALLERADVLVTGDTGVLHVGASMGAPTVILSGPTDPGFVAHRGLPQVVLHRRDACPEWELGPECPRANTCTDRRCIEAIAVEEALSGVRELLRADRVRRSRTSSASTDPERVE